MKFMFHLQDICRCFNIFQNNHELIIVSTPQSITLTNPFRHTAGNLLEKLISLRMAKHFINFPEMVQIKE